MRSVFAKPSNDGTKFSNYLASLSPRELAIVARLTSVDFIAKKPLLAASRNSPCPCGSAKNSSTVTVRDERVPTAQRNLNFKLRWK
jgi:hypothetical protein